MKRAVLAATGIGLAFAALLFVLAPGAVTVAVLGGLLVRGILDVVELVQYRRETR